ncbi:hypothetical protein MRX96_014223 [Rhipicephalus microplus]
MPSCMQLLSAFGTRRIATARDSLDSAVPAGKPAVLRARCDFRSPPHSSCEHAPTTTGIETPELPSGEFSSPQQECVGSSTVIQPEPVAQHPSSHLQPNKRDRQSLARSGPHHYSSAVHQATFGLEAADTGRPRHTPMAPARNIVKGSSMTPVKDSQPA